MTLYLVRHADAKSRSGWHGPDLQRTLSKKGERQAAGLAALLNGAAIAAILSSPAVRCLDTVAPM
ncbi:MAG: phosphoglycerate mutase family protein, partial [Acidimicrobiales bacterium]